MPMMPILSGGLLGGMAVSLALDKARPA